MKIPHNLTQFEGKSVAFLVTGKQDARLYLAHDGEIQRLLSFRIYKPAYSDREGWFGTPTTRSGSILKPVDRAIRLDFWHELEKQLNDLAQQKQINEVILFAPSRYKNDTTKHLPKKIQQKLHQIILGNYFETRPLDLIKKWRQQNMRHLVRMSIH